ncbi:MAG: ABC transporter permease [Cuniculiplasma sp.]
MIGRNGKKRRFTPSVYWRRLYHQFKVFYGSSYGKIGFYILLAFAVITLVTPFVVEHPNYTYIYPEVDTHVASELSHTHLSNVSRTGSSVSIYSPMATIVQNQGTSAIYVGTSSGYIYCYGLGSSVHSKLGKYAPIYKSKLKSGEKMLDPTMFPLINCSQELSGFVSPSLFGRFIVMPFSNGTNGRIVVGQVSDVAVGLTTPAFKVLSTFKYNGTIVGNITSNSEPFVRTVATSIPSFNYENLGINPSGQIYFVTHNATGNYLHRYDVSPVSTLGIERINMTNPVGVVSYGKMFSASKFQSNGILLIWNSTTVNAYSASNGTLEWSHSFANKLNSNVGPVIPSFYQIKYQSSNSVYMAMGNSIERLNLLTGKNQSVVTLVSPIIGLSTTPGSSGAPSSIIAMTDSYAYIISYNSTGALRIKNVPIPFNSGHFSTSATYDQIANSLIFVSEKGSILSFSLTSGSSDPFSWSAGLTPVPSETSNVLYFTNAVTGVGTIALTANNNYIYLYNSTAKDCTPLPPMAKLPSGARALLGTTQGGSDVWSRFMESFGNDWIFGISIGFFTIIISLAVAMYVGYKGGFGGEAVETLSLALFLVPSLALLIALASVINGANFVTLILIVSLTGWPFAAFTLIGVVRGVSARSFVEASRLFGSRGGSIMRRHIMPNIGPLLLYLLALSIGGGIGAVSGLEFLGLAPLTTATWGGMLNAAFSDYFVVVTHPQWILPPAIALTMFIFSLIFVSRGMDEVVNPRLRRR